MMIFHSDDGKKKPPERIETLGGFPQAAMSEAWGLFFNLTVLVNESQQTANKKEDVALSETNGQGLGCVEGLLLLSSSHEPGRAFLDVQP